MNRFDGFTLSTMLLVALTLGGIGPAQADSLPAHSTADQAAHISEPAGGQAQAATSAEKTTAEPDQTSKAAPERQQPSTEPGQAAADTAGWHGLKSSAVWRSAPGTEIKQSEPDKIEIERGEVVIEPNRSITVITPLSQTQIMHKSAVLFRVKRGSERCMVLWDNGPDAVTVISHNHKLKLGPGKEVLITDHDPNYREITESDDIGRRRIKMHQVGSHQHVVTAEFYLLHALQRDPLLYDVAHSKDRHDQTLREHILKTAAVLNMVTHGHGFYATNSGY
jgi:hypothetical protein